MGIWDFFELLDYEPKEKHLFWSFEPDGGTESGLEARNLEGIDLRFNFGPGFVPRFVDICCFCQR